MEMKLGWGKTWPDCLGAVEEAERGVSSKNTKPAALLPALGPLLAAGEVGCLKAVPAARL